MCINSGLTGKVIDVVECLERLRMFAYGARIVTHDDHAGVVLDMICCRIDEVVVAIKTSLAAPSSPDSPPK